MRNAKYAIFNKEYTAEAYKEAHEKYDLGSYRKLCEFEKMFEKFISGFPRRYAMLDRCMNVTGNNVRNVKNSQYCFDTYDTEDSKYVVAGIDGVKDSYDINYAGLNAELCYETTATKGAKNKFNHGAYGREVEYSEFCNNEASIGLFGCISVPSSKKYCILNKQYGEEEYRKLTEKIRKHMTDVPYIDQQGIAYRYGEFFPIEISTFAYNETTAQDYFPISSEEARRKGYAWRERTKRTYAITLKWSDIPDHITDVSNDIVNETIECMHNGVCEDNCASAFRILPQELSMYRLQNLALPRMCPNCRYYERFRQRNPFKLWHRRCNCAGERGESRTAIGETNTYANTAKHFHGATACPNEFETSYAPDRPEIVYCEQCYNAEVA
jgi:hypothetical protein